jgi:hypothetical protein
MLATRSALFEACKGARSRRREILAKLARAQRETRGCECSFATLRAELCSNALGKRFFVTLAKIR